MSLEKTEEGLRDVLKKLEDNPGMSRDEVAELMLSRPSLPGLEGLSSVSEQVIKSLQADPRYKDLPEGYTWNELRLDLSDSRNWYLAGMGHVTPSLDECLRYAKDYIEGARRKTNKAQK